MSAPTTPTADDIARAIVAACREVGENPIAVATGTAFKSKARHYALSALARTFYGVPRTQLASYLSCAGGPKDYAKNSLKKIVGKARWWDSAELARIVEYVQVNKGRGAVTARLGRLKAWASQVKTNAETEQAEEPAAIAAPPIKKTRASMARDVDARIKTKPRTADEQKADAARWRETLPDVPAERGRPSSRGPAPATIVIDEATGKRRLSAAIEGAHVSLSGSAKPNAFALGPSRVIED